MNGFMTTDPATVKKHDEPGVPLGASANSKERLQSAAIRGATHAFSAQGNNHPLDDLKTSTMNRNGARAAAASAGHTARQRSVSPPKPLISAFTAPFPSQLARVSPVQQLAKNFEHASSRENLQVRKMGEGAPWRVVSKSPSHVAARIASSNSHSPLRTPTPLPQVSQDNKFTGEAQKRQSNHAWNRAALEGQCESTESAQSGNVTTVGLPVPLRTVSSAQTLPSLEKSERSPTTETNLNTPSLLSHPLHGSSSTVAAQAATKSFASSNLLSIPQSLSKRKDVLDSIAGFSEDSERGRSPTGRSGSRESQVSVGKDALDRQIPDKSPQVFNDRQLYCERPRMMDSSEPMARLPTLSTQSVSRFPSTSSAKYTDERTGLTERSLADAIVASSLASYRAPSPTTTTAPVPPPPRRSSVSRSIFRHAHSSDTDLSRRASPHKGMRQTLRKHTSDDNESESESVRRKHKHFMKHPNKHREGSRKRWKDKVTERERKRYEGVWAANKGIFLTSPLSSSNADVTLETSTSELVLDLVVRDIWNRSRLPTDALADVWDLVDSQGVGTLTRDEFVLGLWLIDQLLKGRKLPIRVSTTLWASVRYTGGARVPSKY